MIHVASWFDQIVNNLTLYDLTSGWIPCIVLLVGVPAFFLKHNCFEHGCVRVGRVRGDDGHSRCKRHDKITHPERYG